MICQLVIFLAIPALFLQSYFYSQSKPGFFNYAILGTEIARIIIKECVEYIDESKDIFKDILGNSFTWANQELLNLYLRSRCAAEDYIAAGLEVGLNNV